MAETASASRVLYLLRHAKSSWSSPELDDHDRPLAARGEDAVRRIRHHIREAGIAPELVLCSSARRTVMTFEGIAAALPPKVDVQIEEGLYAASSGRLLARLHEVGDLRGVMVIGHNPGLEMLADNLVGGGETALRRRLESKFPTGVLATLTFDGPWSGLAPGGATLEAFVVPREL